MPDGYLVISDLSGGINPTDSPFTIPPTQPVDARNVEWYHANVARKRSGCTALTMTGVTETGYLIRHTNSATTTQLWMITTGTKQFYRTYSTGWAWSSITATVGGTAITSAVSFNKKLFLCNGGVGLTANRLWCIDGTTLRTVGIGAPSAAPTVVDDGSGTYAASARYYKTSLEVMSGTTTLFQSELSSSTAFTPSGSGVSAKVPRPTVSYASDSPTHWTVWGSTDNANYYKLSQIAIATDHYDDTAAPSSYSAGTLAPDVNTNLPFPAVTYLSVDENRLIGARAGLYSSGATNYSRVWWTPVLGTLGTRDDERYLNTTDVKNYLDLDEQEDGPITGISASMNGSVLVFKAHHTYKLVRTGNIEAPYLPVTISKSVGCVAHHSIINAEDEDGGPCVYWLSERGPYRYGAQGFQYLGRDIESLWPNYSPLATTMRGVYYADRNQVWWCGNLAGTAIPALILDVRKCQREGSSARGGWTLYDGPLQRATSICLWEEDTTSGMGVLKPHFISYDVALKVLEGNSGVTDDGTMFDAWVTTKPYLLGGPMQNCGVTQVEVLAAAGGEIGLTLNRDFGLETRELTVDLEAEATETRVIRQVEALELSSAKAMQVTIGDLANTEQTWVIDQVVLKYRPEEPR